MSRTRTIKKSAIDISSFSSKKKIHDINPLDIDNWLLNLSTSQTLQSPPQLIKNEEGELILVAQKTKNFTNVDFHYEFPDNYDYPSFINDISNQIKLVYNLKNEAKDYKVMIWTPYTGKDRNLIFSIPKASMSTVMRVVITIEGRENYEIGIEGQEAQTNFLCMNNDSFSMGLGIASAVNIKFDSSLNCAQPHKNGFRDGNKIKKTPNKRYVLVFDFNVDTTILISHVTAEASKLARGNNRIISNLTEKMEEVFEIESKKDKDVDEFLKSFSDI